MLAEIRAAPEIDLTYLFDDRCSCSFSKYQTMLVFWPDEHVTTMSYDRFSYSDHGLNV